MKRGTDVIYYSSREELKKTGDGDRSQQTSTKMPT